jgi:thioredoxin reductase (NADPH)
VAAVTGERAYLSAVVREAGRLLVVATEQLRELLALDEPLGDAILQLLFRRREWLRGTGAGVRIVGSRYSPETHRLREFAVRNRVAHVWIELERHPEADAWLMGLGIQLQETPVVFARRRRGARQPRERRPCPCHRDAWR